METYVYPAVLYQDKSGSHYLSIPDLGLIAVGNDEKECYINGEKAIKEYFDLASRFDAIIPESSDFQQIVNKYPKNRVVMVSAKVKVNNPKLSKEEQDYKNFMKMFFGEN